MDGTASQDCAESLRDSADFAGAVSVAVGLHAFVKGTDYVRALMPEHVCTSEVIVTVTTAGGLRFESNWCLGCLEDVDPLDAVYRLIPGASLSVRAGGV